MENLNKQFRPQIRLEKMSGPYQDPNCLTLIVILKEYFQNVDFDQKKRQQKSMQNYPVGKE